MKFRLSSQFKRQRGFGAGSRGQVGMRDLRGLFSRRMFIGGTIGAAVTGVLGARMVYMQAFEHERFKTDAVENLIRRPLDPPPRGEILDRFGEAIATQRTIWRVSVRPDETPDLETTVRRIMALAPMRIPDPALRAQREEELIVRLLNRSRRQPRFVPIVVRDDLGSYEDFARIAFQLPTLPGVRADELQSRSYPRGEEFGHLIGYVARANDAEQAADPAVGHPDMRIGKSGVEARLDGWLRGTPGERVERVNARGKVIAEFIRQDFEDGLVPADMKDAQKPRAAIPGKSIVLTLDLELQLTAVARIRRTARLPEEQSGAIVVMDVVTGDLLVFASDPAFDPMKFVNGYPSDAYRALTEDQRSPLYHKAYDGLYPPGSTFKMVVGAAGLRSGAIDPEVRVNCNGSYPFGGSVFHCWKRAGHGPMNFRQALKHSCDTYFYEMARRTGPEEIAQAARDFGFGQRFDIAATGGRAGVVPDAEWKRRERNSPWLPGETLNFGIGQGALLASPLQLAVMTARIASDRGAVVPRLVLEGPPEFVREPVFEPLPFAPDVLARLRDGMFAVTCEPGGTAFIHGDLGLGGPRQAGKTGTSQVRRITMAERARGVIANEDLPWRQRDHALFVSYAPADNPRYACAVIIEHGGGGSKAAAPVAKDVMSAVLARDPARRPVFTLSPLAGGGTLGGARCAHDTCDGSH
jgi:penicillin-binding protein 2